MHTIDFAAAAWAADSAWLIVLMGKECDKDNNGDRDAEKQEKDRTHLRSPLVFKSEWELENDDVVSLLATDCSCVACAKSSN